MNRAAANDLESAAPRQSVILVTGGDGFLGSRLLPLLARAIDGAQIIKIARREKRGYDSSLPIRTIYGDLKDESLWAEIPETITHVFHLAAVIPWQGEERHKATLTADNVSPLAHLIEYSRRWSNIQQIIYSSSVSVYSPTPDFLREDSPRQPTSLYGAAKLAGEELLKTLSARGLATVSLRLSSLYGFGQYQGTVLPIMVKRALQKQELLIFGDGTRTQDFLHCEDAAQAHLLSFQKQARGAYNVGTGTPVTMSELAQTVSRVFTEGKAPIVYQPEKGDGDPGLKLDITKARRELNYEPSIPLESGLQKLKQELGAS